MPIAIGSKAPDFTLKTKTADGPKDVKLSDNFGKHQTVLLFFPAAFTGVCTTEMCDMTNGLAEYEKLGATVLGISVDGPFCAGSVGQGEPHQDHPRQRSEQDRDQGLRRAISQSRRHV